MSKFQSWKQPIQLWHESNQCWFRATANQLKPVLYGLQVNEPWPMLGMPGKVMYDGIIFWVEPIGWGMHNRLMCNCPRCPKEVSYGRLHQHLRVHHEH